MRVARIELTVTDRELLQIIIKKGNDWRECERAQTILMLSEGQTTVEVAKKQGVMPEAIWERRRKWLKQGFSCLPDQPRRRNTNGSALNCIRLTRLNKPLMKSAKALVPHTG